MADIGHGQDLFINADASASPQNFQKLVDTLNANDLKDVQAYFLSNIYPSFSSSPVYQGYKDSLSKAISDKTQPTQPPPLPPTDDAYANLLQKKTDDLSATYDKIYQDVLNSGDQSIDYQFAEPRQKLIEEEANLGRLDSPASIPVLGKLDQTRELAKAGFRTNLLSQKATGLFDLGKATESAAQSASQSSQDIDLRKQTLAQQLDQFTRQLQLNQELGYAGLGNASNIAASNRQPKSTDYLNTGINLLGLFV